MGFGRRIIVDVDASSASVRDFGRGIPFGKLVDVASKMNTGGKFRDSSAFQKSVGLNGVGIKAVNALSTSFEIMSFRGGQCKRALFSMGNLIEESPCDGYRRRRRHTRALRAVGRHIRNYAFREEFVVPLFKNYTFLNAGLAMVFNGQKFSSRHGLLDLLKDNLTPGSAIPYHTPQRRGYRDSHNPCQPIRRGILFLCQRTAYHAGRHALSARSKEAVGRTLSRNTSTAISSTPTFATAWWLPSPYACRMHQCSSRRQRPSSARARCRRTA